MGFRSSGLAFVWDILIVIWGSRLVLHFQYPIYPVILDVPEWSGTISGSGNRGLAYLIGRPADHVSLHSILPSTVLFILWGSGGLFERFWAVHIRL